jgi:Rieske Fe-S protein
MTKWTPKPSDIAWVEELLRVLKDNGTWACPCSQSVFVFDKKAKEYTLQGCSEDPTNRKTIKILTDLGWKKKA